VLDDGRSEEVRRALRRIREAGRRLAILRQDPGGIGTDMAATASEVYAKWRCRLIPDHVLGEMLFKSWIDNAIPVSILLATVTIFSSVVPGFLSVGGLGDNARQLGELMLVVLG